MIRKAEMKDATSIHTLNQNELGYEFDYDTTTSSVTSISEFTYNISCG